MRNAFLKLNSNGIPLDDKFFALIILKALPEPYAATIQVLFAQPDLASTKVITSACNYWNMRTNTKEDESDVAFTARKDLNKNTNRNAGFVNSNSRGTFTASTTLEPIRITPSTVEKQSNLLSQTVETINLRKEPLPTLLP